MSNNGVYTEPSIMLLLKPNIKFMMISKLHLNKSTFKNISSAKPCDNMETGSVFIIYDINVYHYENNNSS